ncbi:hypothetical protein MNBD_ALPHA03-931 [hydrothermal vent metagenome]|uniref:Uncharacterized protein n=1 Tax=hydrothermal vent metagenome TaxID=652676 RepID=A0A3B1B957_9ZZZZ
MTTSISSPIVQFEREAQVSGGKNLHHTTSTSNKK